MRYLAIDPGEKWAVAIITAPDRVFTYTFKDKSQLIEALDCFVRDDIICGIEMIRSLYGKAAASNFTFAKRVGYWEGIFDYFGTMLHEINIAKWQAWAMNKPERPDIKGLSKKEIAKIKRLHEDAIKLESLRAAQAAFPTCKIDSHHVADAVNMARYLRFLHEGEKNEKGKKGKSQSKESCI